MFRNNFFSNSGHVLKYLAGSIMCTFACFATTGCGGGVDFPKHLEFKENWNKKATEGAYESLSIALGDEFLERTEEFKLQDEPGLKDFEISALYVFSENPGPELPGSRMSVMYQLLETSSGKTIPIASVVYLRTRTPTQDHINTFVEYWFITAESVLESLQIDFDGRIDLSVPQIVNGAQIDGQSLKCYEENIVWRCYITPTEYENIVAGYFEWLGKSNAPATPAAAGSSMTDSEKQQCLIYANMQLRIATTTAQFKGIERASEDLRSAIISSQGADCLYYAISEGLFD